jgi:hypothetical protein
MDILQLRTELETLLVDSLGVYTLPNGSETSAVSVRALGERMTPGTTVSGVELVLVRDPGLNPIRQYTNQAALRTWTTYLVDWDNNTDLEALAAKVIEVYPGTGVRTLSVPEGAGPMHQLQLDIQTNPAPTSDCPGA